MTDHPISTQHHATFEGIRHVNPHPVRPELVEGLRQAQPERVKDRVQAQYKRGSTKTVSDHFENVLEMVEIGSGAWRSNDPVRPEFVEGHLGIPTQRIRRTKFMARQAHHERGETPYELDAA